MKYEIYPGRLECQALYSGNLKLGPKSSLSNYNVQIFCLDNDLLDLAITSVLIFSLHTVKRWSFEMQFDVCSNGIYYLQYF
jgi:hypothetical protein